MEEILKSMRVYLPKTALKLLILRKIIKQRIRKQQEFIQDKDFIAFISTATLNSVPKGPPINKLKDIYLSAFEINIYQRTPENYEPDFEGSEIEVLTSDYGIESNTREQ